MVGAGFILRYSATKFTEDENSSVLSDRWEEVGKEITNSDV